MYVCLSGVCRVRWRFHSATDETSGYDSGMFDTRFASTDSFLHNCLIEEGETHVGVLLGLRLLGLLSSGSGTASGGGGSITSGGGSGGGSAACDTTWARQ